MSGEWGLSNSAISQQCCPLCRIEWSAAGEIAGAARLQGNWEIGSVKEMTTPLVKECPVCMWRPNSGSEALSIGSSSVWSGWTKSDFVRLAAWIHPLRTAPIHATLGLALLWTRAEGTSCVRPSDAQVQLIRNQSGEQLLLFSEQPQLCRVNTIW